MQVAQTPHTRDQKSSESPYTNNHQTQHIFFKHPIRHMLSLITSEFPFQYKSFGFPGCQFFASRVNMCLLVDVGWFSTSFSIRQIFINVLISYYSNSSYFYSKRLLSSFEPWHSYCFINIKGVAKGHVCARGPHLDVFI